MVVSIIYIAHIRTEDETPQLLKTHLKEVQYICECIGRKLGIPSVTGLAGILHDLGKYSDEFQAYIREAVANPDDPPRRGSVNHSTAGGKLLMETFHQSKGFTPYMIEMVANAIYSHHGQLLDFVDEDGNSPFLQRQDNDKIPLVSIKERFFREVYDEQTFNNYVAQAEKEFVEFIKKHFQHLKDMKSIIVAINNLLPLLTKYIFSALVDADRTNSKQFDENIPPLESPQIKPLFSKYLHTLEMKLIQLQQTAIPNEITKLRMQMSDNCLEKASTPTGIYTLSIPTGGGKTLASLRFALKHALLHDKQRIIYVVPYTTIIEQNVKSVRELLETDNILEHHSNIALEEDEETEHSFKENELRRKLKNTMDNWETPIIFTTMVQYLDTFYSGKSRNLRRMHNLSNAIVIFDEVQSVPVKCISLFNETMNFLNKQCQSTILLCTATQPALQYVKRNIHIDGEIVEDLQRIEKAFKRTEIVPLLRKEGWTTEHLFEFVNEKLLENNNVLVIMNNKKTAKSLFERLKGYPNAYHLSTAMCAAHRKEVLEEMKTKLKDGEQVICVSTQLIEAGVDVSFECVMRSLAGLDSIAQAAGRCNRNGEVTNRNVYVFNHAEENVTRLKTIERGQECTRLMLLDFNQNQTLFGGELLSTKALTHYFREFYTELASDLDYPVSKINTTLYQILFTDNAQFVQTKGTIQKSRTSLKTAAEYFDVIDANTQAILVPHKAGKKLIAQLTSREKITHFDHFMKQAQQYSVNVFAHEMAILQRENLIRLVDFGAFQLYIALEQAYDDRYGFTVNGEAKLEFMSM